MVVVIARAEAASLEAPITILIEPEPSSSPSVISILSPSLEMVIPSSLISISKPLIPSNTDISKSLSLSLVFGGYMSLSLVFGGLTGAILGSKQLVLKTESYQYLAGS